MFVGWKNSITCAHIVGSISAVVESSFTGITTCLWRVAENTAKKILCPAARVAICAKARKPDKSFVID